MDKKHNFKVPSVTFTGDGSSRRVGFELEFSGLTLEETVDNVLASLGGNTGVKTAAEQLIHVPSLGDFNVEIDWDFLKRTAKANEHNKEDGKEEE